MRCSRVEVSGGFLLLMAWVNYLDRENLLPLTLIACTLHEAGHYIVIRTLGYQVERLRLSAVGAAMTLAKPMGYGQEILAAGAGPAVNLALYILCEDIQWGNTFAGINLVLAIFNLIPVAQLDGGRIFFCMLSLLFGPYWADVIKYVSDRLIVILVLILGTVLFLFCRNSSMLLVALWLGAGLFMGKKEELGLANRNRNR